MRKYKNVRQWTGKIKIVYMACLLAVSLCFTGIIPLINLSTVYAETVSSENGLVKNPKVTSKYIHVSEYKIIDSSDKNSVDKIKKGDKVTVELALSDVRVKTPHAENVKIEVTNDNINKMFEIENGSKKIQIKSGIDSQKNDCLIVSFKGVYTGDTEKLKLRISYIHDILPEDIVEIDFSKSIINDTEESDHKDQETSGDKDDAANGEDKSPSENEDGTDGRGNGQDVIEFPDQSQDNVTDANGNVGDTLDDMYDGGLNNSALGYGDSTSGQISANNTANVLTPTVILKQVAYPEGGILPGEAFELDLMIVATQGSYNINHLIATIELPGGVTFKETNRYYVGSMSPGQTAEAIFKLAADENINASELEFLVSFSWLGAQDNQKISTQTSFILPVRKVSKLEINTLSIPQNINTGYKDGSQSAMLSLKNTGHADAKNIEVKLDGEDLALENTEDGTDVCTIEKIEAGQTVMQMFDIICKNEGEHQGTLTLTYTDEDGNTEKIVRDITLQAMYIKADVEQTVLVNENLIQEDTHVPVWAWIFIGFIMMVGLYLIGKNVYCKNIDKL